MSKYEDLTVDQLLAAIESMTRNAKLALAANDFSLSRTFGDKVTGLKAELSCRSQRFSSEGFGA
jgi:hypothetical protein